MLYSLLKNRSYAPERIKVIVAAYEEVLQELRLTSKDDPLTAIVATKILEVADRGEQLQNRIRDIALHELSSHRGEAVEGT